MSDHFAAVKEPPPGSAPLSVPIPPEPEADRREDRAPAPSGAPPLSVPVPPEKPADSAEDEPEA